MIRAWEVSDYRIALAQPYRRDLQTLKEEREQCLVPKLNRNNRRTRNCEDHPRVEFNGPYPEARDVFSNDLCLDMIMSHLPVQSLLQCRLVCRSWSKSFLQHLVKRDYLIVADENRNNAQEILKKRRQGDPVSVSSLVIVGVPVNIKPITDILWHFGNSLSGLKLVNFLGGSEDLLCLLNSVPNLEVLTLYNPFRREDLHTNGVAAKSLIDYWSNQFPEHVFPMVKKLSWSEIGHVCFLERVLRMFPGLQELSLRNWKCHDPNAFKTLCVQNLKKLTVSIDSGVYFRQRDFHALANLKLKLTQLSLCGIATAFKKDIVCLRKFLTSVAPTLVKLNLNGEDITFGQHKSYAYNNQSGDSGGWRHSPFGVAFPKLEQLEIDSSLLTDLTKIRLMPHLDTLICRFHDCSAWKSIFTEIGQQTQERGVYVGVKKLTLSNIDSSCLIKVVPHFPMVTSLIVDENGVDATAFEAICTKMGDHLESLELKVSKYEETSTNHLLKDTDITGIRAKELKTLAENVFVTSKVVTKSQSKCRREKPYIGDLKALRVLTFSASQYDMTDLSVLYGLCDLRKLEELRLPRCKITDVSLRLLADMPNLKFLHVYKTQGVSLGAVAALRAATTHRSLIVKYTKYK